MRCGLRFGLTTYWLERSQPLPRLARFSPRQALPFPGPNILHHKARAGGASNYPSKYRRTTRTLQIITFKFRLVILCVLQEPIGASPVPHLEPSRIGFLHDVGGAGHVAHSVRCDWKFARRYTSMDLAHSRDVGENRLCQQRSLHRAAIAWNRKNFVENGWISALHALL